jgi:hypothetical protein
MSPTLTSVLAWPAHRRGNRTSKLWPTQRSASQKRMTTSAPGMGGCRRCSCFAAPAVGVSTDVVEVPVSAFPPSDAGGAAGASTLLSVTEEGRPAADAAVCQSVPAPNTDMPGRVRCRCQPRTTIASDIFHNFDQPLARAFARRVHRSITRAAGINSKYRARSAQAPGCAHRAKGS